ncbi:MAG: ATP-binding protein [Saprospiraceae bacterium]|nr:ATP-binding protein [Saprospiraceae bacterium]
MEALIQVQDNLIKDLELKINRTLNIDWDDRLIALVGPRGVGKTTYLLDRVKDSITEGNSTLYTSMDDLYFANNTLLSLADSFVKRGGKFLYLDEIHKYPNWSQELKNIYDRYKTLHVVISGSSILHIKQGEADLSRRAVVYTMQGLSFREYIEIETGFKIAPTSLEEILTNHIELARTITKEIRPLQYFQEYLKHGYFPFYLESKKSYLIKLLSTINLTLEADLPYLKGVEMRHIHKLKKLLYVVSQAVPYKPNIAKLSRDVEVSRATILTYLSYMQDAKLIRMMSYDVHGDSLLTKPEKLFFDNTNMMFAIGHGYANTGSERETFFLNQVGLSNTLTYSDIGDFRINDKYIIEVGGSKKDKKQIADLPNAFIAADMIETGFDNKIPLWLFGFIY